MEDLGRRTFRIESCLGRGGFGEVYRAVMSSPGGLQSEVAVKVLRGDLDPAGQAVQRLRDEGRLLARLDHPTILRVHDLVLLDGRISLVTEFVDGQDLGEVCHGGDPIPLRALVEVIGAVAGALHAAWSSPLGPDGRTLQIVHRDIKPSNVRISRHGQVKLLDFGIARTDRVDREAKTQTNLMVGSPAYMAPERFTSNEMMPASDVFALGCALYEGMAGGDRLLGELTLPMLSALALDDERYAEHVHGKLDPLQRDTPEPVMDLLVAMLAWEPTARPSAADVEHRCEELADAVPGRSLARYCRERGWPKNTAESGALEGKVITEGTLVRSREIAPVETPDLITERGVPSLPPMVVSQDSLLTRPPVQPRRGGLGVLVAGAAILLLGVGALAIGAVALWASGILEPAADPTTDAVADEGPADAPIEVIDAPIEPPTDASADVAPSDEAPRDDAQPVPAPALAPAPAPAPVPVAGPAPVPVLVAAPSSPSPAPVPIVVPVRPTPVAPAVPTGHVTAEGGVSVELRNADRSIALPADVPLGTWQIYGRFNGRDWDHVGPVEVEAGSWVIRCNASMMRCKRENG